MEEPTVITKQHQKYWRAAAGIKHFKNLKNDRWIKRLKFTSLWLLEAQSRNEKKKRIRCAKLRNKNANNYEYLLKRMYSCILSGQWIAVVYLSTEVSIKLFRLEFQTSLLHSYNLAWLNSINNSSTWSKTLESTCLSSIGTYLVLCGMTVGAKASRIVSRLATRPCFLSHLQK